MTFRLNQSKKYKYPVIYHYRDEDGLVKNARFHAFFKRLNKEERQKALSPATEDDNSIENKDLSLLKDVLVDWSGIEDESGEKIPYSAENLEEIDSDCPEVTSAIAFAWLDSIKKINEKNSNQ